MAVQSSVATPSLALPLPTTFPTLSAEKRSEKKPETILDTDDMFLLPISSSKFLNDSSYDSYTVPDSLVVQSSVATPSLPLPTTFPTLSAEKRAEKKPETLLDTDDSFLLPISSSKFLNNSSDDSSTVPDSLAVQSSVATPPLPLPITFPTLRPQTISANNSYLSPTPTLVPVQTNSTISFFNPVDFQLKQKLLEVI